jgi:spore coat polysaccharide biosynthesis protein SpsF
VREKATRLPGKVLKPLGDGNVTQFLLRRLKESRRADVTIVATSTDPRDQVLCDIATAEGVACFRGSLDDKLVRYRDACRTFGLDFAVVVDGDDPFVSIEHIDRLIAHAEDAPVDYVVFDGLPLGAAGFGLAASALERVCRDRPEANTEVWASHFLDNPAFVCDRLTETDDRYRRPQLRMTLDYEEDYRLFKTVVDGLSAQGQASSFANIMAFLADNPEVACINAGVQQAYEAHLRLSGAGADTRIGT